MKIFTVRDREVSSYIDLLRKLYEPMSTETNKKKKVPIIKTLKI